jgi:hypothetical protein
MQNVSATNKILGRATAGAGVVEEISCTAAGRALLDDADAAAQRGTLEIETVADIDYYVNPSTGNDTTGDGSIGTPFATIVHALSLIPKVINHYVAIHLRTGDYTAESIISVSGFSGSGTLDIYGEDDSATVICYGFSITNCTVNVEINYLTTEPEGSSRSFYMWNCTKVELYSVYSDNVQTAGYIAWLYANHSKVEVTDAYISNKAVVVWAARNSEVYVEWLMGSGNVRGFIADGGFIKLFYENDLTATTMYEFFAGGLIINADGIKIPLIPVTSATPTVTVAASDSDATKAEYADYQCDGTADQTEINNAINALPIIVTETGTAQAGGADTITLSANAFSDPKHYIGHRIDLVSGTGSPNLNQTIIAYDPDTHIATIYGSWATQPDATTEYEIKCRTGVVKLLGGNYYISGAITPTTGVCIEGESREGTIIRKSSDNANHMIQPSWWLKRSSVTLRNFTLLGDKSHSNNYNCMLLDNIHYWLLENLVVSGARNNGILFESAGTFCKIRNCHVSDSLYHGIYYTWNVTDLTIEDCDIYNNGQRGISSYLWTPPRVTIRNCKVYKNGYCGIYLGGDNHSSIVSNNRVYLNGYHGIFVSGYRSIISNNIVRANSQAANNTYDNIYLNDWTSYNTVSGNNCYKGDETNKTRYGINVSGGNCNKNLVNANNLESGGTTGALNDSGSNTTTTGNQV